MFTKYAEKDKYLKVFFHYSKLNSKIIAVDKILCLKNVSIKSFFKFSWLEPGIRYEKLQYQIEFNRNISFLVGVRHHFGKK